MNISKDSGTPSGTTIFTPLFFLETGLFTLALLLPALVTRYLTLSLSYARQTEGVASFFSPGFYFADFLSLTLLLPLVLLVSLPARRSLHRLFLTLPVLTFAGILYLAALRYFEIYELPFDWSHLAHLEGGAQMWTSLKSELHGSLLTGLLLLFIFLLAWSALFAKLTDEHPPQRLARTILATVLLSVGLLAALSGAGAREGPGRDGELERERGANLFYSLTLGRLARGGDKSDERTELESETNSPENSTTAGVEKSEKFSYKYDVRSLEDSRRYPRLKFPGEGKQFNIVIYFFEGTSYNYIGQKINGKSVTPNWDRLTQNSLKLNQHHASSPLTINALYSSLTSAYPLPADRWAIKDYPDIKLRSLPEILGEQGYATALLNTGYFDYAGQRGFLKNRKFDLMMDVKELRKPPYTATLNWGIDDRAMIKPSLDFARQAREAGKPFLLFLIPESPHHPYDIPDEKYRLSRPETKQSFREQSFAKFMNALHYSDHALGEFITAMEDADLAKDTLFLIYADHGEAFGQHRRNYNHPFYIYQENVHVPFIIYNKTLFPRPLEYNRVSRHIDIMPTLLDILKIPGDPRHEGESILRAGPNRMAPMHTTWRNDLMGIRDARWKYVYNRKNGGEELFDLEQDPDEQKNLADLNPAVAARYKNYIFRLRRYQKAYYENVTGTNIDWNRTQEKN